MARAMARAGGCIVGTHIGVRIEAWVGVRQGGVESLTRRRERAGVVVVVVVTVVIVESL